MVTIDPIAVINAITGTSCSGVNFTITPTNLTNGIVPAGTTYTWATPSVTGGVTGAASGAGATDITGNLVNPTITPQTATYIVTPTTVSCGNGTPFTISVTVNPVPVVTNMTTTICSNSLFTVTPVNGANGAVPAGTTYSWLAPSVTGSITGGISLTGAANIYGTLHNPTNIAQTATYLVTPSYAACAGLAFTVTVNLNPVAEITSMSKTTGSGLPFALTPTNITDGIIPVGTNFTWPAPTVTGGITGGVSGTASASITGTLFNPTNVPQNATYYVTPTASICGAGAVFTVVITLSPVPYINDMLATACSGSLFSATPTNIVNGIVPFGTTYAWSAPVTTGGVTGGASGAGGSLNIFGTLVNPTNVVQTATYTVIPTSSGGYVGAPFTLTVTINPIATVTAMTAITCGGVSFTVTPTHITDGIIPAGTTFTWSAPTGAGIAGGTSQTIPVNYVTGKLTNTTNTIVNATYMVTPLSGACAGAAFTVTVTLNPTAAITAMTTTYCSGVTFNLTPTNITNGIVPAGTLYTWSAPTGTGFTGGVAEVTGANNINGTLINTNNYGVTATYMVTPISGNCTGAAFTTTVTVSPAPTVNLTLGTQTVCLNTTPSQLGLNINGGAGTISYQWYSNTVNANTGGTPVGVTASTYTPPTPLTTTTAYYYATVSFSSGGCGVITTGNVHELIVNRYATAADLNIAPVIVCSGLNATIVAALSSTSNIINPTYTWYNDAALTNQAGTGSTYNTGVLTNFTSYYVTVSGINACTNLPGTAKQVDVSVSSQAPTMNVVTDKVVCNGSGITINFSSTNASSYTWNNNNTNVGLGASGSGNISFTASNLGTANDTAVISVTPHANGCNGVTQQFNIIVGPTAPLISNAIVSVPSSIRMNYTPVGVSSDISYTWTASQPAGISTTDITNVTMHSTFDPLLTNTTLNPINVSFTVTPYASAPGYCAGPTFNLLVTVEPVPVITDKVVATCSGAAFTVSPTNVPNTTTYTWEFPVVVTGSVTGLNAEASPQSFISQTLTNTGTDDAIVLYTIVPVNGGFNGSPFTITVYVHPNPVLSNNTQPTVCNKSLFNFTPASLTVGTTYTWTRAVVNNISNTAASGTNAISETLVNTGMDPVQATYLFTLTANGCSSPQEQFLVTVNPSLQLTSGTTDVVCSNDNYHYEGTAVAGSTLTWTRAAVAGIANIAMSGTTNTIDEVLLNTSNHPIDVRYVYTINSGLCTDTASLVVTVNPLPVVNTVANQVFCNGDIATVNFSGSTIAGTVYDWTNANSSIGLTTIGQGDIAFIGVNNTALPIATTIKVTPSVNGCTGVSTSFSITINPTPVLSSALNIPTTCSGTPLLYSPTSNTPGTIFAWTRPAVGGILNSAATGNGIVRDTLINTSNAPLEVTYTYILTANGCTNSQIVRVTVNPLPSVSNPGYQLACSNSTKVINFNGSTISGTSYTWTNDNTALGIPANGSGDIFFFARNNTSDSIIGNITVTPKANGCSGIPVTFRVAINPLLTLTSSLTPAPICSNAPFVYTPQSNTGETVFNWSRAAITGISNPPALGTGTIRETLINTTPSPILVTYVINIVSNGCSNRQSVVVQVNPSLSLSNTNINNEICSNQPFTFTPISSITGVQYVWDRQVVNGISNLAASGTGAINESLINISTSPIVVTYRYSLGQGATCSNDQLIRVTVKPTPVLTSLKNISTCSNIPIGYTPVANITGTSFNWSRSVVPGISNPSSVGLIGISESLVNTTTAPVNVNYAYTLSNSNGCVNVQTLTVQVKPAPVAAFVANQSICAGSASAPIIFTSNLANTTFNWFNSEPIIGLSAFGTGNIPAFLAVNNSTGQLNAQIQVTPSVNGCTGTTITAAKISVNRAIRSTTIESAPSIACPGQTVGPFTGSVPLGGDGYNYTFQWQSSIDSVNFTNISGAVSRQLNAPPITANTWFRMNTFSGGCSASTPLVKVPLMPKPNIQFSSSDGYTVSIGNSTQVFATGGISYVWSPRNLVSDYTSPNPLLTPVTQTRFVVSVTNAEGCTDTSGVTINVISGFAIYPNNVLTPNGDGYNDTWKIKNIEYYPDNSIKIYNTNSALVKTLEKYAGDWDGTVNGVKLPSGTYYYVIDLKNGTAVVKGFLTILN